MKKRVLITGLLLLLSSFSLTAMSHERQGFRNGKVIVSALNVRSGPSRHYRPIGVVYRGDRVRITDRSRGWYLIRSHGQIGWVNNAYIRPLRGNRGNDRHYHNDRDYRNDRRPGREQLGYR